MVEYNFEEAGTDFESIPKPARGIGNPGPLDEDVPFLKFVMQTIRDAGKGYMKFSSAKQAEKAHHRITRWVVKEEGFDNLRVARRKDSETGRVTLYWIVQATEDEPSEDQTS